MRSHRAARARRWIAVGATVTITLALVPSLATAQGRASRGRRGLVHLSVTPHGQHLAVGIRSTSRAACRLTISTRRRSLGFGLIRLGTQGHGTIAWRVPDSAPSGTWSFSASCRARSRVGRAERQVILINHGSGRGGLFTNGTIQLQDGATYAGPATAPSAGQAIVDWAASQQGRTYCWDGGSTAGPTHGDGDYAGEAPLCKSPATVGFDCTGLVIFAVYHGTGGQVTITNHSPGQAETVPGQWITNENALQPGDIVYFGRSRAAISHAAIYAGDGMIWDANTAFWKYPDGVHERSLSSERSLGFVGAVRVASTSSTTPTPTPPPTPTPTPTPTPLPALQFPVMNATGGVYWRSGPDWNDAEVTPGTGIYPGTVIQVSCYESGAADVPGSSDSMWEQASWVSGQGSGSGWINEHFINDGSAVNQPSPGAPPCSTSTPGPPVTPPSPAQTWNETAGSVAHTWTNYTNAGGIQGPSIANGQTVAIACRLQGFQVADGNTWWYRIAASPWSDNYYVSADAFYNDGATSGSLLGTPFVDPSVASC